VDNTNQPSASGVFTHVNVTEPGEDVIDEETTALKVAEPTLEDRTSTIAVPSTPVGTSPVEGVIVPNVVEN